MSRIHPFQPTRNKILTSTLQNLTFPYEHLYSDVFLIQYIGITIRQTSIEFVKECKK